MSRRSAWIIDEDNLYDSMDLASEGQKPEIGIMGPQDAPPAFLDELQRSKLVGEQFRIYDDDGILYYTGRILFAKGVDHNSADEVEAFGPLNDFGTPNAGAVRIDYLEGEEWVTL